MVGSNIEMCICTFDIIDNIWMACCSLADQSWIIAICIQDSRLDKRKITCITNPLHDSIERLSMHYIIQ